MCQLKLLLTPCLSTIRMSSHNQRFVRKSQNRDDSTDPAQAQNLLSSHV